MAANIPTLCLSCDTSVFPAACSLNEWFDYQDTYYSTSPRYLSKSSLSLMLLHVPPELYALVSLDAIMLLAEQQELEDPILYQLGRGTYVLQSVLHYYMHSRTRVETRPTYMDTYANTFLLATEVYGHIAQPVQFFVGKEYLLRLSSCLVFSTPYSISHYQIVYPCQRSRFAEIYIMRQL